MGMQFTLHRPMAVRQKLSSAPIHVLPAMTILPHVCDPVVDAKSCSSLQPAADHI